MLNFYTNHAILKYIVCILTTYGSLSVVRPADGLGVDNSVNYRPEVCTTWAWVDKQSSIGTHAPDPSSNHRHETEHVSFCVFL